MVAETIIPPEQRSAHAVGLQKFLDTGEGPVLNQRIEVSALRRDGTQFPAELTVLSPQRIGDSIVFNAFVRDITRRREAVEAVQASEALYHSLVDRLPINVTRKDLKGRITFVNRPFCELVGMSSDELVGKTDYDLSPADLADKYRRDDQYVATTGDVFHAIEENRGDDRVSHFEVWKVPVRDAAGEIVETQAVFWDVTEREENRTALARERDLLRTLMDSLPDLIYVKDIDGCFVTVNRALLNLWGDPTPESIVGKDAFDFAPKELAAEYTLEDREVLETGEPIVDREETVAGPAGARLIYSTTKVPLHDQEGRVSGLVGIDRDITRRKQTEQDLRAARLAADAANRAKGDFLANMSHEIRTPMNAVIGMTELALETDLTASQRDYLSTVRESGNALLSLINDILDFSKIEAGKLDLDHVPFQLRELVGDTMKLLAVRAHHAGLELAWRVDADVPDVLVGDPHRLRQVLVNLVGNAVKFTDQGEVVLDVTCRSRDGEHVALSFAVRDTGVGIPADKQETIFGAFDQADSSSTRRFSGTGLGLAISSRLIELMHGDISVESKVGKGSTFLFTSRFALGDTNAVKEPDTSQFRGTRVLVVDDNATNRRILEEVLNNWGMQPAMASGVDSALDAMRRAHASGQSFPLVLSDVNMPEIDGLTLAKRIRADADLKNTAILLLTSGDRLSDLARCEELGVIGCLMKPVKQSELLEGIAVALGVGATGTTLIGPFEETPGDGLPPLNILLAEDSVPNQKLAVALLEKRGHTVTVVNNGREALEAMDSEAGFDVVLMDVQMPVLDGMEATAAIRRREQNSERHLPIIAMTAHAMTGDRERCLAAGMDEYVSKPIRPAELMGRIAACLSGREISRAAPVEIPASGAGLDWSAALKAMEGDRELLIVIVNSMLEELPILLGELMEAVANSDARLVQRAAHTVSGTMRTFRAEEVMDTAARLEELGRSAEFDGASELLQTLQRQLDQVTDELEAFVTGAGMS